MVDFKYKVTDIAKDFGISTKKVIETFAELTGETRKTGATFEENEVNALMEALTRETAVKDLGEYLASGKEPQPVKQETKKPEAKPQAKKEAPKPEAAKPQPKQPKQPEAPKAEPKAEQAKPAQNAQPKAAQPKPVQQEKRNDKRNDNKQAEKRSEKRVTMQELASETGIKEPVATEQVKVDRAQVSVDTRTVDVNVDKFSARYDDLADSRNMPSKRKNAPTGKKEKFNNRNNRRGQQFGRRRETEAERLQRIQLEKARNAQLKISIPDEITVGELATRLKQNVAKVVAKFMQMGEMHAASTQRWSMKFMFLSKSACSPRKRTAPISWSNVRRSLLLWATLTTAKLPFWTASVPLTLPQAKPAALPRPSALTRSMSTAAPLPSWIRRATKPLPPCVPAARI
mgnify:CR=1 FL=1